MLWWVLSIPVMAFVGLSEREQEDQMERDFGEYVWVKPVKYQGFNPATGLTLAKPSSTITILPHMRQMLIYIHDRIKELWKGKRTRTIPRNQYPSVFMKQEFHRLTNFSFSRVSEWRKEAETNSCWFLPRTGRGPEKVQLEEKYEDFAEWVEKEIESRVAERGATLPILVHLNQLGTKPVVVESLSKH